MVPDHGHRLTFAQSIEVLNLGNIRLFTNWNTETTGVHQEVGVRLPEFRTLHQVPRGISLR